MYRAVTRTCPRLATVLELGDTVVEMLGVTLAEAWAAVTTGVAALAAGCEMS